MICSICGIQELTGSQKLYCSKNCERKGWRDNNKEKILEGKRLYRLQNKEKISLYQKAYKSKTKHINNKLARRLKDAYQCLRCGTNEQLEVHHIKHQRFGGGHNDINNLVVLCKTCHAKWHKYFNIDYWKIK